MIFTKYEINKFSGEFIYIPQPQNYNDCFELIQSDLFRITGRKCSKCELLRIFLFHPVSSTLLWFRLCQYRGFFYKFYHFMYKLSSRLHQVDIPVKTKIGYGFYVGHGIGIVINQDTVIGNNVNLSQFVNIGTNHNTPAIIGDNVYVSPMVCIVEDVVIGCNVTIGAGAVVTKNVPSNATAVGVPAKIINYNSPARYIDNKWEF